MLLTRAPHRPAADDSPVEPLPRSVIRRLVGRVRTALRRDVVLAGSAVAGAVGGLLLGLGAAPWHTLGRTGLSAGWWWDRTVALQSQGLLLLTGTATVAAVLLTAAAGRRAAAGGIAPLARRAGGLIGCQLLAVLLLGLLVNDAFDFYSSWDDLLGTGAGALVVHDSGLGGASAPGGQAAALAARRFALPDGRSGQLQTVTVTGARTGLSEQVGVYVPPQYGEPGWAGHRFPVTLALSGYPGSVKGLEGPLGLPDVMAGLVRQGKVAPMVIVMAQSAVTPPRDTECTDIPGGPQTETFFAQDLPEWIGSHFRVDPPGRWGVMGVSTGGFCAAKLVLAHPEVFRAGISMSGYLSPLTDITTGDLFAGNLALQHQNDPYWRITHQPPPPVSLMLTASRQEHGIYPQVVRFLRAARAPLQVASLIRPTGGHNVTVWRSELPLCLQWLSAKLPAPGSAS